MGTALTNRVDIDDLKQRYNLARVVEQTTGQQVGTRNIRCPFHQDDTPSLHVWPDGQWKCFSAACGKHGDVLDWVGYHLFGEAYQPQQHFKDVLDALGALSIQPTPYVKPRVDVRPTLDSETTDHLQANMQEADYRYWQAQGIPSAVLTHFRVGRTPQRWAFPWFYRGVLSAVKLRRDDQVAPDLEPKYISLKGSRFAAPYNIDALILGETPDAVLICEDEKSALAAAAYGLTAISAPAGSWKPEWAALLTRVKRVVVLADNDAAGEAAAHAIQRTIRRARIINFAPDKDFFDFHIRMLDIPNAAVYIQELLGL